MKIPGFSFGTGMGMDSDDDDHYGGHGEENDAELALSLFCIPWGNFDGRLAVGSIVKAVVEKASGQSVNFFNFF